MANVKISGLTAYTDPVATDVLPIVDLVNDQTKKVKVEDLLKKFGLGTEALPSFAFTGDLDTGIYSPGANQFAVTTGGTQRLLIDASGNTTIQGDLTVNGTTTTVSSNTLSIKDKNIEIAVVSTPTDTTADGGGITLKGASDKTINWVQSTGSWTFNQPTNFNNHVRIDSAGRLLVGTTTEGNADADDLTLQASSGYTGITLRSGTTAGGAIYFSDATSGSGEYDGYITYSQNTQAFSFGTAGNGSPRMLIDSSGNVGVGNSSPAYKLSVLTTGTSDTSLHLATTGGASANGDATNSVRFTGGTNTRWANAKYEAFKHIFHCNGVEKMRIDSTGRLLVGISSSPSAGSGQYGKLVSAGNTLDSTGDGRIILARGKDVSQLASGNDIGGVYFTDSLGNTFASIKSAADSTPGSNDFPGRLAFATTADNASSPTERMRIDSSGNVFIGGTTAASADIALNANGTATFAGDMTAANATVKFATGSGHGYIQVKNSGGTANINLLGSDGSATFGGDVVVGNNPAGGSTNNGLMFRALGGVIARRASGTDNVFAGFISGNASETSKITAAGSATFAGGAFAIASDGDISTNVRCHGSIELDSTGSFSSPKIKLFSNTGAAEFAGNVGIGTSAPVRALQVGSHGSGNGEISLASSTTGNCSILMGDGASGSDFYRGYIQYQNNIDSLVFATSATQQMMIDSSGNVGIGLSDPSNARLMVRGGITTTFGNSPLAIFGSGFAAGYYHTIGFGPTNATWTVPPAGIGYVATSQIDAGKGDLVFGTRDNVANSSPTERMRIDSAGKLFTNRTVSSTSGGHPALQINTISTGTASNSFATGIDFQTEGTSRNRLSVTTDNNWIFYKDSGSSEALRIDSSGNLLVGLTSAVGISGTPADLNSTEIGRGYINISRDDTSAADHIRFGKNGSVASSIGTSTTNSLVFKTGTTERMRISNDGSLHHNSSSHGIATYLTASAGTAKYAFRGHFNTSSGIYGGTISFTVWSNGNVENTNNSYGAISDVKLKENIVDAGSQWDDFKAVKFRKYNFKEETGLETHTQLGVIAQELELTSPGLVYETADKDEDGNDLGTTTKAVKSSILTKKALVALQEAMARIEQLEAKVAALEAG